jgi:hypothetical protein
VNSKFLGGIGLIILAASGAHAATLAVSDFSFENYSVAGGLQYSTSFAGYVPGWTFTTGAGIAAAGSGFNVPTPVPDGTQAAFLQGNSNSVSQTIGGFNVGVVYTLDVWVGTRVANGSTDGNAGVNFLIDGTQVGTTGALASSTPFTEYLVPFTVTSSGSHTLALTNVSAPGDHTSFVDDVHLSFSVPEPAPIAMISSALVLLGVLRRRRAA